MRDALTYTHGPETIREQAEPVGDGYSRLILDVRHGETAWNPASTKHAIHGPARVVYLIHPSSVEARLTDCDDLKADALKAETEEIVAALDPILGDADLTALDVVEHLIARNENAYSGMPDPAALRPMLAAIDKALNAQAVEA